MAFKNILAAVHLSAGPSNALARALLVAREHGAALKVMDLGGLNGAAADTRFAAKAAEAIRLAHAGRPAPQVPIELVAEPARSAAHLAREAGAQGLIVMDHASSRLSSLRGGSLSARLLRLCGGPVLIVKSAVGSGYQRVLVATDLTPVAETLLALGVGISGRSNVEVLHTIRPLHANPLRDAEIPERILRGYLSRRKQESYAHLLRLTEIGALCAKRVTAVVREGEPARHTALQQSHSKADLVVIGKRRQSAALDLLWGGTAQRVLAWCAGDIMVLPHDRADAQTPPDCAPAACSVRTHTTTDEGAHRELD